MIAANRERLAAPDVLRVFAIFTIGWFHIWQQSWLDPGFRIGQYYVNLQQVVRHGAMMVDEMLLLSGFLLALPVAKRMIQGQLPESAGTFYKKRFWRIVPSYYLVIMLTTCFWSIPQGQYSSAGAMVKDLLAHFTFTHTLFYDTYLLSPLPATIWTLSVEVLFYALWPLIAQFYRKSPSITCLALALAGILFRLWVSLHGVTLFMFNQLPAQLDLYALGMAAAMIFARLDASGKPCIRWRRVIAPLGMLAGFAGMVWIMYIQPVPTDGYGAIYRGQMLWRLPMGLLGGCFLVTGCLAPKGLARAMGNRLTCFLSDITYPFFMWHQFLACRLKDWHIPPYVSELPNQAGEQPWKTQYTYICFFAAAALSALFAYGIERPIQKWGMNMKKTAS